MLHELNLILCNISNNYTVLKISNYKFLRDVQYTCHYRSSLSLDIFFFLIQNKAHENKNTSTCRHFENLPNYPHLLAICCNITVDFWFKYRLNTVILKLLLYSCFHFFPIHGHHFHFHVVRMRSKHIQLGFTLGTV